MDHGSIRNLLPQPTRRDRFLGGQAWNTLPGLRLEPKNEFNRGRRGYARIIPKEMNWPIRAYPRHPRFSFFIVTN
jgi:hypothetical protein